MTLAQGDPFVVGDIFSFQQAERIKTNWRAAAAPSNPQPGSLWSDSVTEKLYHRGASAWLEILQAGLDFTLGDGKKLIFGTDIDGTIQYDEATNDAIIFGIPFGTKRGIIICNQDIIGADYTTEILTSVQPRLNLIDADGDSAMAIGFWGDDVPGIMARHHALNINWDGEQDVQFFLGCETGENRYVYVYGFKTGATVKYLRTWIDTSGFGRIEDEDGVTLAKSGGKLGFYGLATPVVKAAHIPDSAGDDAAAVNAILVALENLGLIATA